MLWLRADYQATLARALEGKAVTRFETAYAQLARVDDDEPIGVLVHWQVTTRVGCLRVQLLVG